jgi:hypothetical protein
MDVDTMGAQAAVAAVMEHILNEVETRFFDKCAKGRLCAKKFDNSTKGHHKRMWEFVQGRIASETFIHDVAEYWYNQTLDDLRPCIDDLVEEVQKASDAWVRLIDSMVPVTEQLTPEAKAGRRSLGRAVPALRDLVEKLGRAVLIEEELFPEPEELTDALSKQTVSGRRSFIFGYRLTMCSLLNKGPSQIVRVQ